MEQVIQERIALWSNMNVTIKEEIDHLSPDSLIDAFYRDLSFGTGGMRGIMGIGTNRMNIYTVRAATQGLSHYILKQPRNPQSPRVFIGYDVRNHSRLFAQEAARVLAGNGIEALITTDVCPTPLVSFGCRAYACSAAIMITASHNPPEYNGYKVYWKGGAQIVAPQDQEIIEEVRLIQSLSTVSLAPLDSPLIQWIGNEIDQAYLIELDSLRRPSFSDLRILYTNLHGTGLRLIPTALQRWGFSNIDLVHPQSPLDGSFPRAPSPNPEEAEALALGSSYLLETKADILLATDPDADRLGAVVRHQQQSIRLNGHEIGSLCLAHLLHRAAPPAESAVIKTIVTTELIRKIALHAGIDCFNVLTGFKYIAELIRTWEQSGQPQFLFGAEESHGYLFGTFVRDKDSISAACLLSEAAAAAKKVNRTLIDQLHDLYRIHGVHRQSLSTLAFADSPQGLENMQMCMHRLRQTPLQTIGGQPVIHCDDYLQKCPSSDVLHFWLSEESKLIIRPSGTEPKIKIYAECCEPPANNIEESVARCEKKLKGLIDSCQSFLRK